MTASVSTRYDATLVITEVVGLGLDYVPDPTITHDVTDSAGTFNGSTNVPVTKAWSDSLSLTAGAYTINLASLARGSVASAVDLTGLKVRHIKIVCPSANTAPVLFTKGASNGYQLGQSSTTIISVEPGGEALLYFPGTKVTADTVASGVKNIDVSSSDQDAVFNIALDAGT